VGDISSLWGQRWEMVHVTSKVTWGVALEKPENAAPTSSTGACTSSARLGEWHLLQRILNA
jgi:hypothetical protein